MASGIVFYCFYFIFSFIKVYVVPVVFITININMTWHCVVYSTYPITA